MAEKSEVSKWATVPAAGAVAAVVCAAFYLIGRGFAVPGPTDFWRVVATPLAQSLVGAGAITAALLALHNGSKTRAQDREHHRQTMVRDRETNLLDRYTTAAKQLGDDQSTIREAGVHALAALADDWLRHGADTWNQFDTTNADVANAYSQARVCIHLLCSYLRANHRVKIQIGDFNCEDKPAVPFDTAEQAVRSSIVGTLRERISEWRTVESEWINAGVIREANQFVIDLSRAILHRTDWEGADLRNAILVKTDLHFADMANVDLEGARLPQANLQKTNIVNANLSYTDLERSNLSGAVLVKANLSHAVATKAKFAGAFLSGTNFTDTDLRGAELDGAHLTAEAIFSQGTVVSASTTWTQGFRPKSVTFLPGNQAWVRQLRRSEQG